MPDELREIRELVQQLLVNQAAHAVEQREMKDDVEQIKHVLLEGNGQPPLTATVARLDERTSVLEGDRKATKAYYIAIIAAVATVVSALIGAT